MQIFPVRMDANSAFSREGKFFNQALVQFLHLAILGANFARLKDADSALLKDAKIARDS
jgi:hypothetical protein